MDLWSSCGSQRDRTRFFSRGILSGVVGCQGVTRLQWESLDEDEVMKWPFTQGDTMIEQLIQADTPVFVLKERVGRETDILQVFWMQDSSVTNDEALVAIDTSLRRLENPMENVNGEIRDPPVGPPPAEVVYRPVPASFWINIAEHGRLAVPVMPRDAPRDAPHDDSDDLQAEDEDEDLRQPRRRRHSPDDNDEPAARRNRQ
ncbi:SET domain-containing protein [Caenorhabditis elegans]|uniref:SET domain-containing protein n=1 Tax=Caenorhabditis elegans TaxID=6239 RepID=O45863_CAEEL|nr:SET domain-containing protein [Caenorhabditis elegans]CAB04872.2 SET domain-containing protein [Caenorhabditis elegans]|eukprot:NP_499787.2 Uncharacterized protein CELE_T27E9.6 [Caenorhabditis elegans]